MTDVPQMDVPLAPPKVKMTDVMKFLSVPEKPVEMKEFREFWESCTEAEKTQFKNDVVS
jgi:hypothetical protein